MKLVRLNSKKEGKNSLRILSFVAVFFLATSMLFGSNFAAFGYGYGYDYNDEVNEAENENNETSDEDETNNSFVKKDDDLDEDSNYKDVKKYKELKDYKKFRESYKIIKNLKKNNYPAYWQWKAVYYEYKQTKNPLLREQYKVYKKYKQYKKYYSYVKKHK